MQQVRLPQIGVPTCLTGDEMRLKMMQLILDKVASLNMYFPPRPIPANPGTPVDHYSPEVMTSLTLVPAVCAM